MGKKKIIILDVDGTLTQKQSIWEYLLKEKGKWDKEGAENLRKFIKKEISYQEFCDLDAALLQGEKYDELKKIAYSTPMHRGIGELFGTLKEKKYIICLVSTGLKLLVDYFLERYEIDYFKVNDLEQHNGICTGKSIINIHEQGKGDVVNEIFKRYGEVHLSAMGDSEGDVPVFEKADVSFAINSTSKRLNALAQHTLFSDNLMDTTKYL